MSKKFTFALMALAMSAFTAAAVPPINEDPIIDVDDIPGVTKQYTQTVVTLLSGNELPVTIEHSDVHFGDNGMVYFLNFTGGDHDTYVLGAKNTDTEISIPLPQLEYVDVGVMSDGGDLTAVLDLVKSAPYPEDIIEKVIAMGVGSMLDMYLPLLCGDWYASAYNTETSVIMKINEDESMQLEFPEGLLLGVSVTPPLNELRCPIQQPIKSITYTPEFETGIDMIDSEDVSVVYYDLQGRQVVNPAEGSIYISVTTKADGSKVAKKVVK